VRQQSKDCPVSLGGVEYFSQSTYRRRHSTPFPQLQRSIKYVRKEQEKSGKLKRRGNKLRINGRDDVYLLSYFIHKSTRSYQSFGIAAELPELSKSYDAWE